MLRERMRVVMGRRGRWGVSPMRDRRDPVKFKIKREKDFAWPGLLVMELDGCLKMQLVFKLTQVHTPVAEAIIARAEVVVPYTQLHWLSD